MAKLSEYEKKYSAIAFERRDGILQVTLHTEGKPLRWGAAIHEELPDAFYNIGNDRENRVVILTGAGDEFSGPTVTSPEDSFFKARPTVELADKLIHEGKHCLINMLNIEAPIICAVNGPATRHSEIPLMGDIVIAAEHAYFQDSAHFPTGQVPGDGVHIVYPLLMGMNRGRYFLLTGQELKADEAHRLGMVAEVLPKEKLMPRAWELAQQLAKRPTILLRYTRVVLNEYLKRQMLDLLPFGMYVESLALMEKPAGKE